MTMRGGKKAYVRIPGTRRVLPDKSDYVWLFNTYSDKEYLHKKDLTEEDKSHIVILTHAKLVHHNGVGFKLTEQGTSAFTKISDRALMLRMGVPFSFKRVISTAMEVYTGSTWYRVPFDKSYIISNGVIVVRGKDVVTTTKTVTAQGKLWNPADDKKSRLVMDFISDIKGKVADECVVYPYRYQRPILDKKGIFWFMSSDKEVKVPIAEIYYDAVFHLSPRVVGDFSTGTVEYNGHNILIVRSPGAGRKVKLYGDVVAIIAPLYGAKMETPAC